MEQGVDVGVGVVAVLVGSGVTVSVGVGLGLGVLVGSPVGVSVGLGVGHGSGSVDVGDGDAVAGSLGCDAVLVTAVGWGPSVAAAEGDAWVDPAAGWPDPAGSTTDDDTGVGTGAGRASTPDGSPVAGRFWPPPAAAAGSRSVVSGAPVA